MNEIYIIVENIPYPHVDNPSDYEECVCYSLGYFTDVSLANEVCERVNLQYLKDQGYTKEQIENDELEDEHRDRFGYTSISPASKN